MDTTGHERTRHCAGSGPRGPGFKSRAPDHTGPPTNFRLQNQRFCGSSESAGSKIPQEVANRQGVLVPLAVDLNSLSSNR